MGNYLYQTLYQSFICIHILNNNIQVHTHIVYFEELLLEPIIKML